jgi:hypothetical protein
LTLPQGGIGGAIQVETGYLLTSQAALVDQALFGWTDLLQDVDDSWLAAT